MELNKKVCRHIDDINAAFADAKERYNNGEKDFFVVYGKSENVVVAFISKELVRGEKLDFLKEHKNSIHRIIYVIGKDFATDYERGGGIKPFVVAI